ncbi:MAG: nodulation protein E [gamma proteobacterium symbiont of Bathyaustriella thionipta]|nr:nodulation protein E [gamma proteobacterium symbiont of Bathyaustriella thionipta]MCU7949463.1 nodulation protein E [gamma proteobacterium symbiont of Bathyaustriella thionipta]MCU7953118.1 nodulation protein E [gamma proteobacterium symbiont of Bathyaustriella thionipta]MCU7956050.1 nodulation protein E [gamma proteobacterium symbiont of Bathyaustriella thionipta]MCU7966964.1 nodulation protein E [gamma proteobacterium symbiont of Bathyaustriella thionipta]
MSDGASPKPLNMTERQTTIEEFTNYCHEEKERRMNSGEDFNESAYQEAKELTLRKLQVLEDEGWV